MKKKRNVIIQRYGKMLLLTEKQANKVRPVIQNYLITEGKLRSILYKIEELEKQYTSQSQ